MVQISLLVYMSACLPPELGCPEPTWSQGQGRMPRSTRRDRRLQHARLKPNRHRRASTAASTGQTVSRLAARRQVCQNTHMAYLPTRSELVQYCVCLVRHVAIKRGQDRAPVDAGTGLGRRGRRQPAERGLLAPGSCGRQGSADVSLFSTLLLFFSVNLQRAPPLREWMVRWDGQGRICLETRPVSMEFRDEQILHGSVLGSRVPMRPAS